MSNGLKTLALATILAAGTASMALAQGYAPNNPVSGAAAGASSGAAAGNAAAGPLGAIVGGAVGTASGTLAGTTNMVTGAPVVTTGSVPPTCGRGYVYYSGGCYPAR